MRTKPSGRRRPERKPAPKRLDPSWRFSIGYFVLMLLLLLVWQEILPLAVRTISYSEFKAAVNRGEVKAVAIGREEINGRIQKKPASPEDGSTNAVANPAARNATNNIDSFSFRAVRV